VTRIILAVGLLLGVAASGHAASNCEVMGIHLIPDVTVTGYMYVKAGKSCSIQSANSPGGNTGLEVSRRPTNGQVQISGFKIFYKPRPGFVGKDSFGYLRHALDARTGRPIRLPVNVDVTVNP
jgi:hypothetical protein